MKLEELFSLLEKNENKIKMVIGSNEYITFLSFIKQISEKVQKSLTTIPGYVIVPITDRCTNFFLLLLDNLILICEYNKEFAKKNNIYCDPSLLLNLKKNICSKETFISQIPAYSECYIKTKTMPTIFIINDMLLEGRNINDFIYECENIFNNKIKDNSFNFTNFFTILVNYKFHYSALLLERYAKKLESQKIIENATVYHEISWKSNVYKALSPCDFSTSTTGLLTFTIPLPNIESKVPSNKKLSSFDHIITKLHGIEEEHYVLKSSNVFCDITSKVSVIPIPKTSQIGSNANQTFSVKFLCDNLLLNNIYLLWKKIIEDLSLKSELQPLKDFIERKNDLINKNNFKEYINWIKNINEFIISYLIFKKFYKEFFNDDFDIMSLLNFINFEKISLNLNYYQFDNNSKQFIYHDLTELLPILFNWDINLGELENYLSILFNNSNNTIYNSILEDIVELDDPLIYKLQDIISDWAYNYERTKKEVELSSVPFSERFLCEHPSKHSHKLEDFIFDKNKNKIKILALVSQFIEQNDLETIIRLNQNNLIFRYVTDESALQILPNRYTNIIPALVEINKIPFSEDVKLSKIKNLIDNYKEKYPNIPEDFKNNILEFYARLRYTYLSINDFYIFYLNNYQNIILSEQNERFNVLNRRLAILDMYR